MAAAGLAIAGLASAPALAQTKIRLIALPFSESLGAVIAMKEGYFKEAGLEIEMTKMPGAAMMVPVLQSGRADIILSNTVTTLQAIEQGLDATLLAPSAVVRAKAPDSTTALMVRKGTARSLKDLVGKRIAINVINSTAWLYMVGMFDKHGISRDQLRFVEIPFPQMNDPLLNGQIDAIGQVEPFKTVLLGTGKVEALGYSYVEVQPNADITQYIALTSWVKEHRDAAVKFARAVIRGSKLANSNEAATRQINVEFTRLNPTLKDKVQIPRFGTEVNGEEVRKTMELMLKFGLLKKPIDVSSRVMKLD
ncbi:MAG: hypothetical protein A3H32_15470 [Betaproteobacteria bacterium RIFCSPLOWO2_02_FULL_63_19]|nr:MAG: hypothetical protein A3H32_15470 [Betaproteobacteria bacterium RIFCSPLOWO2_02_FULL_63_19]